MKNKKKLVELKDNFVINFKKMKTLIVLLSVFLQLNLEFNSKIICFMAVHDNRISHNYIKYISNFKVCSVCFY